MKKQNKTKQNKTNNKAKRKQKTNKQTNKNNNNDFLLKKALKNTIFWMRFFNTILNFMIP